ncbi:AbrB/MazE/SpoVT family DNA-binding domain-containing protein [Halalkalibacterium halodurans]|uniref:AbrB/MazE/SpoVT family DNA-binding domain-containing protein n=1 Tax=Halalkalibacterium halodurans TaxID=86665 RepID=UPI001067B6F2|nr:AbrB/MazE/SpoVT family DNA-binding domain-containing protein [Halalkalibacterium halodurans]TES45767.1 AbrB/MazE/SpoVT family DNA-binding domain-containing protein [Halalkalibacterium halodurans]
MTETFTSKKKQDSLINTELTCSLKNGQSITIPRPIREKLSFFPGDEVTVSLTAESNELMIRKVKGDTLDNKMIISERGAIRIPVELRRFLRLEREESFDIFVLREDEGILLKKERFA